MPAGRRTDGPRGGPRSAPHSAGRCWCGKVLRAVAPPAGHAGGGAHRDDDRGVARLRRAVQGSGCRSRRRQARTPRGEGPQRGRRDDGGTRASGARGRGCSSSAGRSARSATPSSTVWRCPLWDSTSSRSTDWRHPRSGTRDQAPGRGGEPAERTGRHDVGGAALLRRRAVCRGGTGLWRRAGPGVGRGGCSAATADSWSRGPGTGPSGWRCRGTGGRTRPMQLPLCREDRCPACDGVGRGPAGADRDPDEGVHRRAGGRGDNQARPWRAAPPPPVGEAGRVLRPGPVPVRPGVVRGGAAGADQRHPGQPGPRAGEPVVIVPGPRPPRRGRAGDRVPPSGRPARHPGHARRMVARTAAPCPGRHPVRSPGFDEQRRHLRRPLHHRRRPLRIPPGQGGGPRRDRNARSPRCPPRRLPRRRT